MASASSALSGALKALADDTLDFLTKNAIVFNPVMVPPEYRSDDRRSSFRSAKAWVKLVQSPKATNIYDIEFVARKDLPTEKNAIDAFVLAYKSDQKDDDVPYVDIPIKAYTENTFLFTVGLTGCSVIVTRWDSKTCRVYHDRHMDSAVLYDNVQMRVDFNDYRIGGRYLSHTGNAITLMLFQGGEWKMFLQRQLPHRDTSTLTWETHAVKQTSPVTKEALVKAFINRRTVIQQRVKSNGKKLKVGDSLIAGAVVGGVDVEVANHEQAISEWKALRDAIKSEIDIYRQNPSRDLNSTYDRFADDNDDSKQIDETYVWLRIRYGPEFDSDWC